MADKWPLANGNWSSAANWNGGTLPQPGDDVYADGKTVTVDQDINTASLRNTLRSGGTTGGSFSIAAGTGSRSITANIITGSPTCLTNNGIGTTGPVTINGNINGGSGLNAAGYAVGVGSTIINGNIKGGTGGIGAPGVLTSTGANIVVTINGNAEGATVGAGAGLRMLSGTAFVTLNGDITNTATAPAIITGSAGHFIITGSINSISSAIPVANVIGSTAATFNLTNDLTKRNSVYLSSVQCVVNGNIDASTENGFVVSVDNGATLTVNGNIYGGGSDQAGVGVSVLNGSLLVRGNVFGRVGSAIVVFSSTSAINRLLIVGGTITGSNSATTGYGLLSQSVNPVCVFGSVIDGLFAVAVRQLSTGTTIVKSLGSVRQVNINGGSDQ